MQKASVLWNLAEAAPRISSDLNEVKENMKAVHESITCSRKRLRERGLTKRERGKLERKIEYYHDWSFQTEAELKNKHPAFSEAISKIECELRELASIYEVLANVHRFEHR
jgi:hypothetical protein